MDAPVGEAYTHVATLKRFTLLLPVLVGLCVLVGFLLERGRTSKLPAFTPARRPEFRELIPPAGSAHLVGRIVDPEGNPVPEAAIYLRSAEIPAWTYSDANGEFRLDGLSPEPGDAVVLAWGFPPTDFAVTPGGAPVSLALPPRSDRLPELPEIERADLAGRVVHPLDRGQAYEVALLPALSPDVLQGPIAVRTLTDLDGHFRFSDLALGRYRVRVLPEWARGSSWPDLVAAGDAELDFRRDGEAVELELAVGALSGRLRDPSDLPLEAALVLVSRADSPSSVWPPVLSGPDGSWRLDDLPVGEYLVELRAGQAVLISPPHRIESGRVLALPMTTLRIRADRPSPQQPGAPGPEVPDPPGPQVPGSEGPEGIEPPPGGDGD